MISINDLRQIHFRHLSNHCTDCDEIWHMYASKKEGFSNLNKSSLSDLFSSNYANELLGTYVMNFCSVLLYVTMLYHIFDFLNRCTDLLQVFVWMFHKWTPICLFVCLCLTSHRQ